MEAFEILAEGVAGGRRGERDNPEDVVQQQGGDQQADVLLLLVALVPSLVAPALVRESEEQGEAVQEGTERTGAIATEKVLGGTTGGGTGGRPSLRWASTWPRVPATQPPSSSRARAITIGAVFIMLPRVPVMLSSRLRPALSFMPFPPPQPWSMWDQPLTTIMAEHTTS